MSWPDERHQPLRAGVTRVDVDADLGAADRRQRRRTPSTATTGRTSSSSPLQPGRWHSMPKLKLRAIHGDTRPVYLGWSILRSRCPWPSRSRGWRRATLTATASPRSSWPLPEPPLPAARRFRQQDLTAYEHTGASASGRAHYYTTHPTGDTFTNRDNPTIADLDRDGTVPEIVVGGNVFNANGSLAAGPVRGGSGLPVGVATMTGSTPGPSRWSPTSIWKATRRL